MKNNKKKLAAAKAAYTKAKKNSKPGEGKRFSALAKMFKEEGKSDPDGLAAYIGRKKYGGKKMAKWSKK